VGVCLRVRQLGAVRPRHRAQATGWPSTGRRTGSTVWRRRCSRRLWRPMGQSPPVCVGRPPNRPASLRISSRPCRNRPGRGTKGGPTGGQGFPDVTRLVGDGEKSERSEQLAPLLHQPEAAVERLRARHDLADMAIRGEVRLRLAHVRELALAPMRNRGWAVTAAELRALRSSTRGVRGRARARGARSHPRRGLGRARPACVEWWSRGRFEARLALSRLPSPLWATTPFAPARPLRPVRRGW